MLDMLATEFARLSSGLTDLTAEVIKLTAALTNQQQLCNVRMAQVADDITELREGRAEVTATHLRTVEAERDRERKEKSEWTRLIAVATLSFLAALLIAKLTGK
jgi:predicted nucleic acid-binding protein